MCACVFGIERVREKIGSSGGQRPYIQSERVGWRELSERISTKTDEEMIREGGMVGVEALRKRECVYSLAHICLA